MRYIDIHTHKDYSAEHEFALRSYDLNELGESPRGYFSVGCHPWFSVYDESLGRLAAQENCLAIGECGLDKLRGPSLEIQTTSLEAQIQLSEQLGKPMILHVVKTYNEIIALRKKHLPKQPWVIHGFNKSAELAKALTDAGFYFSFGSALAQEHNRRVLASIPDGFILAETDEGSMPIGQVYKHMAEASGITVEKLERLISRNFKNVFGSHADELVRTR